MSEMVSAPNYEKMYEDLLHEHKKAVEENKWLQDQMRVCKIEVAKLNAQMDVVRLIFGNNKGR